MNCQHCRPWQLPADRLRIADLEAAHADEMRRVGDLQAALRLVVSELDEPMSALSRAQLRAHVKKELARLGG